MQLGDNTCQEGVWTSARITEDGGRRGEVLGIHRVAPAWHCELSPPLHLPMALGDLHLRDVQLQDADGINAQDRSKYARRESVDDGGVRSSSSVGCRAARGLRLQVLAAQPATNIF